MPDLAVLFDRLGKRVPKLKGHLVVNGVWLIVENLQIATEAGNLIFNFFTQSVTGSHRQDHYQNAQRYGNDRNADDRPGNTPFG